jgi:hypothetical protein
MRTLAGIRTATEVMQTQVNSSPMALDIQDESVRMSPRSQDTSNSLPLVANAQAETTSPAAELVIPRQPEQFQDDIWAIKWTEIVRQFLQPSPNGLPISIEELEQLCEAGVQAERTITEYCDSYLTAWHPEPPQDAKSLQRNPETRFNPERDGDHPCAEHFQIPSGNFRHVENYVARLNACQRHMCSTYYCLKRNRCRLNASWKLRKKSLVKLKQVRTKQGDIVNTCIFECARNDGWLNVLMKELFHDWSANIDMQPVIDLGRVVTYLTK